LAQQRLEQKIREREHVEQEPQVARRIQQASLPKEVPTLKGWEISPHYQPAREVGGDFYDFFELDNGQFGLVVGDATGKGMPAALVMATTCGMLRVVAKSSNSRGEYSGGSTRRCLPYPTQYVRHPLLRAPGSRERKPHLRQCRT
jgi:serine phosphatase RsbU (regulator of sigma subunit)